MKCRGEFIHITSISGTLSSQIKELLKYSWNFSTLLRGTLILFLYRLFLNGVFHEKIWSILLHLKMGTYSSISYRFIVLKKWIGIVVNVHSAFGKCSSFHPSHKDKQDNHSTFISEKNLPKLLFNRSLQENRGNKLKSKPEKVPEYLVSTEPSNPLSYPIRELRTNYFIIRSFVIRTPPPFFRSFGRNSRTKSGNKSTPWSALQSY